MGGKYKITPHKDMLALVKLGERQGWSVEPSGSGHLRWYPPARLKIKLPAGHKYLTTASTPDGNTSFRTNRRKLVKAGLYLAMDEYNRAMEELGHGDEPSPPSDHEDKDSVWCCRRDDLECPERFTTAAARDVHEMEDHMPAQSTRSAQDDAAAMAAAASGSQVPPTPATTPTGRKKVPVYPVSCCIPGSGGRACGWEGTTFGLTAHWTGPKHGIPVKTAKAMWRNQKELLAVRRGAPRFKLEKDEIPPAPAGETPSRDDPSQPLVKRIQQLLWPEGVPADVDMLLAWAEAIPAIEALERVVRDRTEARG